MKKYLLIAFLLTFSTLCFASSKVMLISVYKKEHRLNLVGYDYNIIKSYNIMMGREPVGIKSKEGDMKTPEGEYTLDWKNAESLYHKSIHISYPNKDDQNRAAKLGVNPGGDIMLHGLPNEFKLIKSALKNYGIDGLADSTIRDLLPHFDWTNGCIAVTDSEIDEIYSLIDIPTQILIME